LSPGPGPSKADSASFISAASHESLAMIRKNDLYYDGDSDGEDQDIQEVWFSGGHGCVFWIANCAVNCRF